MQRGHAGGAQLCIHNLPQVVRTSTRNRSQRSDADSQLGCAIIESAMQEGARIFRADANRTFRSELGS